MLDQKKRLAELLSRTDYWTNERVFNEAEKIYKSMVAKKMQNKKRDRTGEKYGEFTIIRPGEIDKEWVARCACGKERLVKNQNMSKLTHCKSCAAKLRMARRANEPRKPKKDKFTDRQDWVVTKKPKLLPEQRYQLDYSKCSYPCVGKLIKEYGKSASFEVLECDDHDGDILRNLGCRISLGKERVVPL